MVEKTNAYEFEPSSGTKMVSYIEDAERASFSGRLKAALAARGHDSSPSKFVADFNLRADGLAVTVHAARKWLMGEAIPAQARLQVIAAWLGINAAWLRFGDAGNSMDVPQPAGFDEMDRQLVGDIGILSESNKRILKVLVKSMLQEENALSGFTRAPGKRVDG
jgi:predicted transcriptional regulator